MLGCSQTSPLSFTVPAGFALPSNGERQEYLRVKLDQADTGCSLQLYNNQSSGVSASLSVSDGLAIRPPFTEVKQGDELVFIPYSELLA
jgi:molybdopterin molybdotransferase